MIAQLLNDKPGPSKSAQNSIEGNEVNLNLDKKCASNTSTRITNGENPPSPYVSGGKEPSTEKGKSSGATSNETMGMGVGTNIPGKDTSSKSSQGISKSGTSSADKSLPSNSKGKSPAENSG